MTALGRKNATAFLELRLSKDQIKIMQYCLQRHMPVSFYGYGLGKSTLRDRLRKAGFGLVYAPEDCGGSCNALSVPNVCDGVALRVKMQDSPSNDVLEESFTDEDLRMSICEYK